MPNSLWHWSGILFLWVITLVITAIFISLDLKWKRVFQSVCQCSRSKHCPWCKRGCKKWKWKSFYLQFSCQTVIYGFDATHCRMFLVHTHTGYPNITLTKLNKFQHMCWMYNTCRLCEESRAQRQFVLNFGFGTFGFWLGLVWACQYLPSYDTKLSKPVFCVFPHCCLLWLCIIH